jgi:hypothetical protein
MAEEELSTSIARLVNRNQTPPSNHHTTLLTVTMKVVIKFNANRFYFKAI